MVATRSALSSPAPGRGRSTRVSMLPPGGEFHVRLASGGNGRERPAVHEGTRLGADAGSARGRSRLRVFGEPFGSSNCGMS